MQDVLDLCKKYGVSCLQEEEEENTYLQNKPQTKDQVCASRGTAAGPRAAVEGSRTGIDRWKSYGSRTKDLILKFGGLDMDSGPASRKNRVHTKNSY